MEALKLVTWSAIRTGKLMKCPEASVNRWQLPERSLMSLKVILLDEPLSALDLKVRTEMQYELRELQQRLGITFIFVTHDQEEALAMSVMKFLSFIKGKFSKVGHQSIFMMSQSTGLWQILSENLIL